MPNLWRIDLVGEGPGLEAIVNSFFFDDPTGTAIAPTAADVAGGFAVSIAPVILAALSNDYVLVLIRATCIDGDAIGLATEDFSLAGTAGSLIAAAGNIVFAAVLQKRSAISARYARGRNFIGPVPASQISRDGVFTDGGGRIDDVGTALIGGFNSLGVEPFPIATLAGHSRWPEEIYYMIYAGINPIIGIQRRRRIRQGT